LILFGTRGFKIRETYWSCLVSCFGL